LNTSLELQEISSVKNGSAQRRGAEKILAAIFPVRCDAAPARVFQEIMEANCHLN
jgi:hypothetical protein